MNDLSSLKAKMQKLSYLALRLAVISFHANSSEGKDISRLNAISASKHARRLMKELLHRSNGKLPKLTKD